jgi:hypothetical protein
MKCLKCGNDIEDNFKCPFCGYLNKDESKKQNKINENKLKHYDNIDDKEKYKNVKNKIVNILFKILCYAQVVFSIMMALICFALEKPFFPFISWVIVAIVFVPKVKVLIGQKITNIRKWLFPLRIILIILAWFIFICNISEIYENEWISDNGICVTLKDNVADVVEDGIKYHGNYTTQYIDGITNIIVTTENKNFTFYFKYNDDVVEFYYVKNNKKTYLVPIIKNSDYTYIESENGLK